MREENTSAASPARDARIDSLRGLSLLGILLAHSSIDPSSVAGHVLWSWGNGQAPMWFALIAGMCIPMSRHSRAYGVVRGLVLLAFGMILALASPNVLIVLVPLGIAMAVCSAISSRHTRMILGVILVTLAPVAQRMIAVIVGSHQGVMDARVVAHPEQILTLITGTYPVAEWTGLVLIGSCVTIEMLSNAKVAVTAAMGLIVSTAVFLLTPGATDRSLSHVLSVTSGFDSIPAAIATPYGHTGSPLSMIIGVCSLLLVGYALTAVKRIPVIDSWGRYSLTIYSLTCIILSASGPQDGYYRWVAVSILSTIIIWIMSAFGVSDPLSKALSRITSSIVSAIPSRRRS